MKALLGGILLLATLAAGSAFGYVQDSEGRDWRRAEMRQRNYERAMAIRERARYRHEAQSEAHRLRHEMARERRELVREEARQRREMRREYRRDFGRVY